MDQGSSIEANNGSGNREISRLLWKWKAPAIPFPEPAESSKHISIQFLQGPF
jgi:hypothetical protein